MSTVTCQLNIKCQISKLYVQMLPPAADIFGIILLSQSVRNVPKTTEMLEKCNRAEKNGAGMKGSGMKGTG